MDHMDPANKENSGLQLPPLVQEQLPPAGSVPTEREAAGPELASVPAASVPGTGLPVATPAIALSLPGQTPQAPSAGVVPAASGTTLPADDGDLIEKEWVTKAKQIVER